MNHTRMKALLVVSLLILVLAVGSFALTACASNPPAEQESTPVEQTVDDTTDTNTGNGEPVYSNPAETVIEE